MSPTNKGIYESGLFGFKNLDSFKTLKNAVGELCARDRSGFYYFTLHDLKHIDSCMEILELFFGKLKERMTNLEDIFKEKDRQLLVAAVYLHDIGLYITENQSEEIKANIQKKDIYEFLRETHHERIEEKVSHWHSLLRSCGLDSFDISDLCQICRGHRRVNLYEYSLRTRKLSAILRLVDELDIGENRAPAEFLEEHILEMDLHSRWHWIKHYFVAQWREENIECVRSGERPELVFKVKNSLPAEYPQHIFLKEIYRPIKRVIEAEGVGNILKNDWGFEVKVDTNIDRLEAIPHSMAGVDLRHSLNYYLNYHDLEEENSLKPGKEDKFEDYCRKIYNNSPADLRDPLKKNIPGEYYTCIEKIYKGEIEKKVQELAEHYRSQNNYRKAVKYFLMWANIENSYIPTDTITDKIFISNEVINKMEEAFKIRDSDLSTWNSKEEYALLIEYGRLKRFTGEWNNAKKMFEKCLELSREIEDDEIKAESQLELGSLIFEMGETKKGFEYVEKALELQKSKGLGVGLVKIFRALGNMHREHANWTEAEEKTKLATDLMKFLIEKDINGDINLKCRADREILVRKMILCDCWRELGNLYASTNRIKEASRLYDRCLDYSRLEQFGCTFKHIEGIMLYHNGNLELKCNNIPAALKLLLESKGIIEEFGNPVRLAFIHDALGKVYSQSTQASDLQEAEKYFKLALESRKKSNHEYFEGFTHHNIGKLYKKYNNPEKLEAAVEEVTRSIEIFEKLKKFDVGDSYFTLGKIYLLLGREHDAMEQFKKATEKLKISFPGNPERVKPIEFEIKKLKNPDGIPFDEIDYLIEAGEYRFHDWLRENVKEPDISLEADHLIGETDLKNLSQLIIGGVQAGDDSAVVRIPHSSKYDLLITTDAAPGSLTRSNDVGKGKYAARFSVIHSTSDILAMGGIPVAVLLNLYLTRDATFEYATTVIKTVQEEAKKYGMALIGGDLKERDRQSIGCIGVGLVERGNVICRNGAKTNDILAVTLTKGIKLGTRWMHELIRYKRLEGQFETFIGRNYLEEHLLLPKEEIFAAAQKGHLTSAIDTSDGILACLQLLGKFSQVGFVLEETLLQEVVHPEVEEICREMDLNPIHLIFNAGHDWEIVVTVDRDNFEQTRCAVQEAGGDLVPIGEVVEIDKVKKGTVKIKMKNNREIDFPFFTDEKFVQNPYQNRIQEWLDLRSYFL